MKRISILIIIISICSLAYTQTFPEHNIYDTDLLPPSFFKANRQKLLKTLGDSALVVLYSAGEHKRTTDVEYKFRQDDDFFYFTGCNEPNSILLLSSSGFVVEESSGNILVHEALLVDQRDLHRESWIGKKLGPEGAKKVLGFEYGAANDELNTILSNAIDNVSDIYLPIAPEESKDPLSMFIGGINAFTESVRDKKEIRSPLKVIQAMRDIKLSEELTLMRKAIELSIVGHKKMMKACRPGMFEYQLQAEFEHTITNGGAEYVAYPCIVGSGENSVILHYDSNRKQMKSGEVVVMDCGAEYHNYASDITRTIPVNGKFTNAQREIYEIVLKAQAEAMKLIKPGIKYREEPTRKAQEVIRDGLLRLGIIKDSLDWRTYFTHGLGHAIGLSAHDISVDNILRPNQVWTVEPGIYIPINAKGVDKKYWNIGIRIEDEVLVAENGVVELSSALPKKIEEIERMMRKK